MRSIKPLVLMGFGALTATAESDAACSNPGSPSVTTMYVTVPASPITETVYATNPGSPSVGSNADTVLPTLTVTNAITETVYVASLPVKPSIDSAVVPVLTVTNSVASTQVIQVVKATSAPGPYSFTEDNGTTIWLGGQTPPASAALLTSTSFITLQPLSTPVSDDASASTTTSYLTITSTKTVMHTYTNTLTEAVLSAPSSVKPFTAYGYTGYGSAGWNVTLSTFVTLKVNPTGSGRISPSLFEAGIADIGTSSYHGGLSASPTHSTNSTPAVKRRQIGEVIDATIDGAVVSWTNSYDGTGSITSDIGPAFVAVTATAPPFEGAASSTFSEASSPARISTNPDITPTTTIGIYPWNLASTPNDLVPAASTARQPGKNPMPSISTTDIVSVLSAALTVRPTSSATPTKAFSVNFSSTSTGPNVAGPSCGDSPAQFTIDFDDLPSFSAGADDIDIPPIFNPYRKLYWDGDFGYVPPPTDPFPPHSPPQLAIFRESGLGMGFNSSSAAGPEYVGGIGSGPRADYSAFWFDANSAWLGCANGGPDDCAITITGYAEYNDNVPAANQTVIQPPCPGLENCSLALVHFDEGFRVLYTLQIIATVDGKAVDWFMDDLELSWSNNTCAAQLMRSSSE